MGAAFHQGDDPDLRECAPLATAGAAVAELGGVVGGVGHIDDGAVDRHDPQGPEERPTVALVATGTQTASKSLPITSWPSRVLACEIADGIGTIHSPDRIRKPRSPLVSFRTTSSYPSQVNRHNANTRYTTTRAGSSRTRV